MYITKIKYEYILYMLETGERESFFLRQMANKNTFNLCLKNN